VDCVGEIITAAFRCAIVPVSSRSLCVLVSFVQGGPKMAPFCIRLYFVKY